MYYKYTIWPNVFGHVAICTLLTSYFRIIVVILPRALVKQDVVGQEGPEVQSMIQRWSVVLKSKLRAGHPSFSTPTLANHVQYVEGALCTGPLLCWKRFGEIQLNSILFVQCLKYHNAIAYKYIIGVLPTCGNSLWMTNIQV